MDSQPFDAAKALLAEERPDVVLVGYWTVGNVVVFALDPDSVDDQVLVWRDGAVAWETVGPVAENPTDFGDALDRDPTPYSDPERLSLIVNALAADEDTPPALLAQAKADLAAAQ